MMLKPLSPSTKIAFLVILITVGVFNFSYFAKATAWVVADAEYQNKILGTVDRLSDIQMSADGTKAYLVNDLDNVVQQYTLSTAWDFNTASASGSYDFDTNNHYWAEAIFFKPDGSKLYLFRDDKSINQYSLGTNWDITTLSFDSVSYDPEDTISISSATGIYIRPDGTKMYLSDNGNEKIYQYTLSTGWDLSTASYEKDTGLLCDAGCNDTEAVFFKDDGTKMYVLHEGTRNAVDQYSLSVAWDVATLTDDNAAYDIGSQSTDGTGIYIGNSGAYMYISDLVDDRAYQYQLQDLINPLVSTFTPADNSVTHIRNNNLSIVFNEAVDAKTGGTISIYKTDDTLVETFTIPDAKVTGTGTTTITIDPTSFLDSNAGYYVQISADAFDDTSGNSYAGIADKTTWNFTTATDTIPSVSLFSPADNGQLVNINSNLLIIFDEAVDAESGNITLYKSDDTQIEQFNVTSDITGSGTTTITINPTAPLTGGTDYYVQIDATAFDDVTGNSYPGISDKTTWNFTTAAAPIACASPTWVSSTIEDNITIDALRMADLDADGDMDIVSTGAYGTDWYTNDGSENFSDNIDLGANADGTDMIIIDVDSDGDLDIINSNRDDNQIQWMDNDGSENFTLKTVGSVANPWSVHADDIDGDGDIDVLSTEFDNDDVVWYENNGSESFTKRIIDSYNDGAYSVASADFDGDGDKDLVAVGTSINGTHSFYRNNGGTPNTFTETSVYASSAEDVYIADINGDGELDFATVRAGGTLAWYENNGSESFTRHVAGTGFTNGNEIIATDVNGDGDIDLVTASYDGDASWWKNDGSENFTEYEIQAGDAGRTLRSIEMGDLNNDGYMDAILPENTMNDVIWLRQTCDATNPTVNTLSPADDATDVAIDSNLIITFDEAVDAETSGTVSLYKSDDTLIQTFTIPDAGLTGTGTNTITLDPSDDLTEGASYYVQISADAFDDSSGNSYAGIADKTSWTFTTVAAPIVTPPAPAPVVTPPAPASSVTSTSTPSSSGGGYRAGSAPWDNPRSYVLKTQSKTSTTAKKEINYSYLKIRQSIACNSNEKTDSARCFWNSVSLAYADSILNKENSFVLEKEDLERIIKKIVFLKGSYNRICMEKQSKICPALEKLIEHGEYFMH